MKKSIRPLAIILALVATIALGFVGYNLIKGIIAENTGDPDRAIVVGEATINYFEGFEAIIKDDKAYATGTNVYGDVIFVNRNEALDETKLICKDAVTIMRSQCPGLGALRAGTISSYSANVDDIDWEGGQVGKQGIILARFLAIYEDGDPHAAL